MGRNNEQEQVLQALKSEDSTVRSVQINNLSEQFSEGSYFIGEERTPRYWLARRGSSTSNWVIILTYESDKNYDSVNSEFCSEWKEQLPPTFKARFDYCG